MNTNWFTKFGLRGRSTKAVPVGLLNSLVYSKENFYYAYSSGTRGGTN